MATLKTVAFESYTITRDDGLYYTSMYENLYFYIVDGQEVFSYE